jgi:hypothetical protein
MSKKVKVVAVSGGLQRPSRTLTLVEALIEALGERASIETRLIELGEVGPKLAGALYPNQLPAEVRDDIAAIESADFLIVASPVYAPPSPACSSTCSTSSTTTPSTTCRCSSPPPAAATAMRWSSTTSCVRCSASSRRTPCRSACMRRGRLRELPGDQPGLQARIELAAERAAPSCAPRRACPPQLAAA